MSQVKIVNMMNLGRLTTVTGLLSLLPLLSGCPKPWPGSLKTIRLSGTVTDQHGAPAAHVPLEVYARYGTIVSAPREELAGGSRADATGRFDFSFEADLDAQTYYLTPEVRSMAWQNEFESFECDRSGCMIYREDAHVQITMRVVRR